MKRSSSSVLTLSAIVGLALAGQSASAGSVFSDDFSTSSLNSTTPSGPTATSTDYQYLAGKSSSVTPSISSGSLTYGIASTSSGSAEVQALFPSYSMNIGDTLTMQVVFTDTAGILTGNGFLGIGMYNSGGVGPIAGGMDGTMSSSTDLGSLQGTAGWQGYVGQMAYAGQSSRIMDRLAQSATTANDQDLVASGSSSQSYHDPSGSTVGGSGITSAITLTAGNQYTAVLSYNLTASGLVIQNDLYDGAGTGGTLLSSTVTSAQGTPVATSFDGLGVGWIERGSETTTIDLNSINIDASAVPEPASMAFLGLGALGMILGYRRNRR